MDHYTATVEKNGIVSTLGFYARSEEEALRRLAGHQVKELTRK